LSHYAKAIEVHQGRPILYGCGDCLNDYEGIRGHESYRPELVLGYILDLDAHGTLMRLEMLPFRLCRCRLNNASAEEAEWLRARMDRECGKCGRGVRLADGRLVMEV
jgi:poly-gamma-glutamate synthesis protein (capsule biosynthesis protein)